MDPIVAGKLGEFLQASGPWGLTALCIGFIAMLLNYIKSLHKQGVEMADKQAAELKALAIKTAEGLSTSSATVAAQAVAIDRSNTTQQQILDVVRNTPGQHADLAKMLDRNYDKMEAVTDIVRNAMAAASVALIERRGGRQ